MPGALAEMVQATRAIDRTTGAPYLTGLRFTRKLRLLDVGGFRRSVPGRVHSGGRGVPVRPDLSPPPDHPGLASRLAGAARRIGYPLG